MDGRIRWLDNARAIGMVLIFQGHIIEKYILKGSYPGGALQTAFSLIYSFHMPFFFFLSGYVYKDRPEGLVKSLLRAAINLYIPFLAFNLLGIAIYLAYLKATGDQWRGQPVMDLWRLLIGSGVFNGNTWFLSCLFSLQAVHLVVVKSFRIKSTRALLLMLAASAVLGWVVVRWQDALPMESLYRGEYFGIFAALVALFFYQAGVVARRLGLERTLGFTPLLLAVLPLWVVLSVLNLRHLPLLYGMFPATMVNYLMVGNHALFLLSALLGTYAVLIVSYRMPAFYGLQFVGRGSLIFLGLNGFLAMYVNKQIVFPVHSGPIFFVLLPALTAASMCLCAPLAVPMHKGWARLRGILMERFL